MKGMQQIKRGTGFNGLLKYLLSHEKAQEDGRIIGGSMYGNDVQSLTKEFAQVRKLRPDVEKPVWHNSLRLPAGDPCTDLQWGEIADDYMKSMGFDVRQCKYVVVKHDDENAVHIAACRVHEDATLYLGKNENLASTRHISALEKKYGLTITKGLEYDESNHIVAGADAHAGRLTAKEVQKAKRTGLEVPKTRVKAAIAEVLAQGPCSATELVQRLQNTGVTAKPNIAAGDSRKMNGFSFSVEEKKKTISFKGSEVGHSWKQLQDSGITYDKNEDFCLHKKPVSQPVHELVPPAPVAPTSADIKRKLWHQQATVLDADSFNVHFDRTDVSQERVTPINGLSVTSIDERMEELEQYEQKDYIVCVEPVSTKWRYVRVHGMKHTQYIDMVDQGYKPNLVVQVSDLNAEAVIRVPVERIGRAENANTGTTVALTKQFGTGMEEKAQRVPLAGFRVNDFVAVIRVKAAAICEKTKTLFTGIAERLRHRGPELREQTETQLENLGINGVTAHDLQVIKKHRGPELDETETPRTVPTQVTGKVVHQNGATAPSAPKRNRSRDDDLSL